MPCFSNLKNEKPEFFASLKQIDNQIIRSKTKVLIDAMFNDDYERVRTLKEKGLLSNNNIFQFMLSDGTIDRYIVTNSSKADLLCHFINSEYLRVSNAKEFHSGEVEAIELFSKEINSKMNKVNLGRIDNFKINQLIEALEKLVVHLK